jgi:hypothetical protein
LFCQNALLVAPGAARVDLDIGTSERDLRTVNVLAPSRRNSPAKSEPLIVKYNGFTMAGDFRL